MKIVPGSFVPPEDQGYVFGSIILPDGATLARTGAVGATLQAMMAENSAIDHVFVVTGFDLDRRRQQDQCGDDLHHPQALA
jgi:multidrug efflux pump subunit AcrB